MKILRLISCATLLFVTLTGCTEVRTKEPFGESDSIGKKAQATLEGVWYSPTTRRERWNRFTVSIQEDGKLGLMLMENADGKTLSYELQFRKVNKELVFYRPKNRPDEGWQFCWPGMAFNTMAHEKGADDITLVLCMPDEKSFRKLGLKTEKKKVLTPPLGIPETNDGDSDSYEVSMLTESPDDMAEKLKSVDFRTLMVPTAPFVLIRHDLMNLTAKSHGKTSAK